MKTLKYIMPIILLLIVSGCYKEMKEASTNLVPPNIQSLEINENFDWRLTNDITFNITSHSPRVFSITSENENTIYYKGNHPGDNSTETIKINVPSTISQLKINGSSVLIAGANLNVNLSNLKYSLINNSINFNGTNSYCEIQDIEGLNGVNSFTIEAWVYQANNTDYSRLFHKIYGVNDISIATYSGRFYVEVGNGSNTYAYWPGYAGAIANNTWFHFAAVYDGTKTNPNERIKLYIDGVAVGLAFTGSIPASTYAFPSGTYQFLSHDQRLGGNMDEVRIWNHARSEIQINNNMNVELTGAEFGFLAYYKLDEIVSGFQTEDASGNHSNAMFFGGYSLSTNAPFIYAPDTDGDGINDTNDDYPNDADRTFDNYFPAAGFGSLGFEDLWPGRGDFDFNDVVLDYRFQVVTNASNKVVEIFGKFPVKASGAYLHNGFGYSLPDIHSDFIGNPQKLIVSGSDIQEGYISLNLYGHEDLQTYPTIIVFDDIFNILEHPGVGLGVNTEDWTPFVEYDTLTITMTPDATIYEIDDFSLITWNPFIMVNQTRSHEVHLPDYAPTDLMDISLFGQWEDDSDPGTNRYFKTASNLPWAIDIPVAFEWSYEKKEITRAYLHFAEWAMSSGVDFNDWYEDKFEYRVSEYIYTH